jgi:hypothetical protein
MRLDIIISFVAFSWLRAETSSHQVHMIIRFTHDDALFSRTLRECVLVRVFLSFIGHRGFTVFYTARHRSVECNLPPTSYCTHPR